MAADSEVVVVAAEDSAVVAMVEAVSVECHVPIVVASIEDGNTFYILFI